MRGPLSSWFTEDHEWLDERLKHSVGDPGTFDRQTFEAFQAGLLHHSALEEELRLPAARRARSGASHPLARGLRIDRGAISSLLVPTPDAGIVLRLRSFLEPHNAVEEEPRGPLRDLRRVTRTGDRRDPRAYPRIPHREDGSSPRRPRRVPDDGGGAAEFRPAGRASFTRTDKEIAI